MAETTPNGGGVTLSRGLIWFIGVAVTLATVLGVPWARGLASEQQTLITEQNTQAKTLVSIDTRLGFLLEEQRTRAGDSALLAVLMSRVTELERKHADDG